MTVFQRPRPSVLVLCEWKIILTKAGYVRNEKRFVAHTRRIMPLVLRTSILLDLGPTPRTLLFSRRIFFSYVDTRWSCWGPTSSSGGLVQTALWVLP